MFQHFLQQYKYDVYTIGASSHWKSLTWKEWILLALCLAGFIGYPLLFLGRQIHTYFISAAIGMLAFYLLFRALNSRAEKERQERFTRYRTRKLEPLIVMLQQLGFYHVSKIDWLLQCCNAELKRPKNEQLGISDIFFKFIFPTLSVLFGLIIKDIDVQTGLLLALLIILVFFLVCGIKAGIIPIIQNLIYPDQDIICFLESELQYIKADLTDENQNDI